LPAGSNLRAVWILPGRRRPYKEAEWRDALVVIEHGEIEVECLAGGRRRFGSGDVLCLAGLPLPALHNQGTDPAMDGGDLPGSPPTPETSIS
ncbi:MAG: hypothetical protein ACREA0_08365, partial [bacterium]